MFRLAGPATDDHENSYRLADGGRDFQVVAVLSAVGVHADKNDLACPQTLDFAGPGDGLQPSWHPAAVNVDFPLFLPVLPHALGVDVHHNTLAAEATGGLMDELRIFYCRRVDRDLVAAG